MELNPVIIVGTGPEARIALDIFNANKVLAYGFITEDAEKVHTDLNDVGVFGTPEDEDVMRVLSDSKVDYIIASGEIDRREELYSKVVELTKRPAINAIHPNTTISEYVKMGFGNIVNAGVVANPNVEIGDLNILQAHVSIEPDVKIGNYNTIGSGVRIGGNVVIEDQVFIGTGAVIHPGVKLGRGCMVGAGSVVLRPVEEGQTVFGNPAQATG